MRLTIREEAKDEAANHVAWYAERNTQAAERLSELFVSAVASIARDPYQYPLLEYPRSRRKIRRVRLRKFPIMILYEILENEVDVFAVAHTSQRPGYWRSRIRKR